MHLNFYLFIKLFQIFVNFVIEIINYLPKIEVLS